MSATGLQGLLSMLSGMGGGGQTQQGGDPSATMGQYGDMLSIMLGQLAGAVAPGTIGDRLGQVGAQQGQSRIAAGAAQDQQQQLVELLSGLTGSGVDTTGVKVGPDGSLQVTGTAAPRVDQVELSGEGQTLGSERPGSVPPGGVAPLNTGGGNQAAAPFPKLSLSK